MKKFYSLFLLMLFAIVGAGQAWAREYVAGDKVIVGSLDIDDVIHYGVEFEGDDMVDFLLYFCNSEEDINGNDYIKISNFDGNDYTNSSKYVSGSSFKVIGKDDSDIFQTYFYLIPVNSDTPDNRLVLILDENSTTAFSADPDVTYDEIRVTRTLKADVWNTFCMPFNMTKVQLDANLGSDAEVKRFNRLTVEDENFTLSFSDIDKNSGTLAGAAYMVRTKQDVSEVVVKNAQTNAADNSNSKTSNDYTVTFSRTLHKQVVPVGSYIISNNLFYLVDSEVYIKGFRGYFSVTGPTQSNAKNLTFDIDGELVTEIDGVNVAAAYTNLFDLQGRHVTDAHKGMYIKNGRKVFIK